jgi:predicted DNA-binding transcriptional regulator YafY
MKSGRIYRQYQWIIKTLLEHKGVTFDELNRKWVEDDVADGKPLQRSTFNRHRDSLLDIFGIVIECDLATYRYYIVNPEVLRSDSIARWLLSTMSVHAALSDCAAVKNRIVLENVPAADFLPVIISAIKAGRKVEMTYQRFGAPPYDKTVAPYALKLFHQRWYMLAFTGNHYATYSLDRMQAVRLSDETFTMAEGFSPHDFFSEYFGVYCPADTPMAHVVVRAYDFTPNYLRTLPLHDSQRELSSGEDYTDFSFDIRPTDDFLGQLMSHGAGIEVLEPADVREKIQEMIKNSLKRY